MDIQDVVRAGEGRLQRLGVVQRMHLLRHVHEDHAVGILRRRIAKDEDRRADACAADLDGLFEIGDGQIACAEVGQRLTDRDRTVPVGVRLHHTEKTAALRDVRKNFVIIMFQIVHGHVGPGSFECFHIMPRK